jgi:hypothetical protein
LYTSSAVLEKLHFCKAALVRQNGVAELENIGRFPKRKGALLSIQSNEYIHVTIAVETV